MNQKLDYASWVPKKLIVMIGTVSGVFFVLFLLSFLIESNVVILISRAILLLIAIFFLSMFAYFSHAQKLLSYEGGGAQGKILDNVLNHLNWDGNGKLLDIGCGSGAMAIKAAKKLPNAEILGIDYWGTEWDYGQKQCENNAKLEGVSERIRFQKGNAAKLDFEDETFDSAVSNFVFHEVRSQPDKLALIREALRVVKPGGSFSFSDVYFSKSHYKNLDGLITELSKEVTELHFVDTRKENIIPKFLITPFIAGDMGLIYGKK